MRRAERSLPRGASASTTGRPAWGTASAGLAARSPPGETRELADHLGHCHALRGAGFALVCGGESVHHFLAARLVTTLLAAALLITGAVLAL